MGDNVLQSIGLFVCIGGLLVVVLGAFLARSAFGNRRQNRMDRDDPNIWKDRGSERPRHDSDEIESRGGFGNAPTRRSAPPPARDRSTRSSFGGTRRSAPPPRQQDDDDVQSRGGFGGGR